jgi:hypothetical protein
MPWEKVRRAASSNAGTSGALITLRQKQIAYNASFIRGENLTRTTRVTIHTDQHARRLGFEFHTNADDPDSLAVVPDGGSGNRASDARITQAQALLRQPWLQALLHNRVSKRFTPYRERGLWVIDLGPSFEVEITSPLDVPAEVSGVYRYLDRDEITYIGRGKIRQRMSDTARDHWVYDRVQFSPLNDADAEQRWEQLLLAEYEAKHGRLPRENRVRGYIPTAD